MRLSALHRTSDSDSSAPEWDTYIDVSDLMERQIER